jgi:hypothetical protein
MGHGALPATDVFAVCSRLGRPVEPVSTQRFPQGAMQKAHDSASEAYQHGQRRRHEKLKKSLSNPGDDMHKCIL